MVETPRWFRFFANLPSSMSLDNSILTNVPTDPQAFANWFVQVAAILGGGIAVILVAVGGYKILMSNGDQQKIVDGKEQIQNAVLGFMLVLLAVTVIKWVFSLLGINTVTF